jgi:hypothetical protein
MAIKQTKLAKKADPTNYDRVSKLIKPVGEVDETVSALFYGRSGTGKTALLSTFPKKILLLDIRERGTETIARVEGIDVLEVNDWDTFEQAFWLMDSGTHDYSTVGLDQISQLQAVAMDKVRKDDSMGPDETLSKRQWGQISGLMQTWLMNYRNLQSKGINVVFLAHDRSTVGDDANEDQIDPSVGARLMPSLAATVNGMVSMIGNTFIREKFEGVGKEKKRTVQYCLRVGPHAYYATKIRRPPDAGPLPDVIVNPSYSKLLRLSRGEDLGVTKKTVKKTVKKLKR